MNTWIEVFRRPSRIAVAQIIDDPDRVVTCFSIIQEVLQGFDDERTFQVARSAMYALPCVEAPMTPALVDAAVDIHRRARRAGVTVRSSVDCLIAACASRHRLTGVHRDRDYAKPSTIVPLEHIDITPLLKSSRSR